MLTFKVKLRNRSKNNIFFIVSIYSYTKPEFRFCADNNQIKHNLYIFLLGLRQDNTRVAGSPTCLKVSTSGACEDLDMETEEEEDVRARGLNITKWHDNIYSMLVPQVIAVMS